MLISMTFSAPVPWLDVRRRMAACLAFSIGAHVFAMYARVPSLSVLPSTILPAIDVRLMKLSHPAPAEQAAQLPSRTPRSTPQPQSEPTPDAAAVAAESAPEKTPESIARADSVPTTPVLTSPNEIPRAIIETPEASKPPEVAKPPTEPEQVIPEPALTEAEKANINARYLAESAVDRKATALDEAPVPEYPPEALKDGITGCVLVMVYIGATGMVEDIDVVRSDPPGVFDREAMRAFINKRYLPALQGNTPVRSRVPGVASFELEGKPPLLCALRYYPLVAELNGLPAASAAPAAQR